MESSLGETEQKQPGWGGPFIVPELQALAPPTVSGPVPSLGRLGLVLLISQEHFVAAAGPYSPHACYI